MTQDAAIIAAGAEVLRQGADCLGRAAERLGPDFAAAARALAEADSFTTVIGVGKSGSIGRKFAASLLSTGHGAAFLHPTDALHGDIGIADHSTLAVLLSHSGNTGELVTLVPVLRQFGVASALIARSRECVLADYVDWVIETGVDEEAGIGGLAPTSSSTTTLALCDALMMASLSLRGFSLETFGRYHPGGMLGQKLRRVGDEMTPLASLTWLSPDTGIYDVLEQITQGGQGFGIVSERPAGSAVKAADVGFISDGDIRRAAQDRDGFAAMTAASVMTRGPQAVRESALAIEALRIMEQYAITSLLCTDDDGVIVGAVHIHSIVSRELGLASPGALRGAKAT
ncbi:MAG: KpsF/GutQ family sugar-phosphate isomerase [Proteobacteria bacterium]|nr:KpsF/GutQ family sugar-phosphate isomerase [Pseudomonadota bacterium]